MPVGPSGHRHTINRGSLFVWTSASSCVNNKLKTHARDNQIRSLNKKTLRFINKHKHNLNFTRGLKHYTIIIILNMTSGRAFTAKAKDTTFYGYNESPEITDGLKAPFQMNNYITAVHNICCISCMDKSADKCLFKR